MLHKGKLKKRGEESSSGRSPSTFTNKYLNWIPHPNKKMLHSKSTYFYRWGSRKKNYNKLSSLSSSLTYIIPSVCSLALLVGGVMMINPPYNDTPKSYAESITTLETDNHISLVLNDAAEQVTQATADTVSYRTNSFSVNYSLTSSYAIYLNSMNGYTGELIGAQNPSAKINGVGTEVRPDEFGNNTWGYAIADGSVSGEDLFYSSIPAYGSVVQAAKVVEVTPDDAISEDTATRDYTLAFAAKIGSDSPADHYQTKVYLSVVRTPGYLYSIAYDANGGSNAPTTQTFVDRTGIDSIKVNLSSSAPVAPNKKRFAGWSLSAEGEAIYLASEEVTLTASNPKITLYAVWEDITDMTGLDYMQEMTNGVCEESKIGQTVQLEDRRESGKKYWIAKLKDGNCWMTQNLAYNIPADGVLYAKDTNVSSDVSIKSIPLESVESWGYSQTHIKYYNPGTMVKTNPSTVNGCNGSGITTLNNSSCISGGWRDVSGLTARSTTAGNGDESTNTSTNVVDSTSYDAHYLSGNYYSWYAATAGMGDKTSSICPKGWKLPTSGSGSYNTSGSFAFLFRQYGLATGDNVGKVSDNGYIVYNAPLYYLRAGSVGTSNNNGVMSNAGRYGQYWTADAYQNNAVYSFFFSENAIFYPSDSSNTSYAGLPIRCVHDPNVNY